MYAIFEPVELGPLAVGNRLIRSATWLGLAGPSGEVTERLLERYEELGQGGTGLVVTGYASVSAEGRHAPGMLGAQADALVPGLSELADAIHRGGARACLQLVHAGGQTRSGWIGGNAPVAPSFLPHPQYPEVPRQLSQEGISRIIGDFGRAAARAREAGFDMVQLHAAHGFLINQFLSPATNHRTDRYGGTLRNRFWFLQQVVTSVQGLAGMDFPVAVKLNGSDFVPEGFSIVEACQVAEWLQTQGVCLIEVSGGTPASGEMGPSRSGVKPGEGEAYFRDLASAVKRRVQCPVALVGGLRRLDTLKDLLLEGVADFFSLSRPLIWEPDLPKRWASGDTAPARCISCNGCFAPGRAGEGVRCVVRDREQEEPATARGE